MSNPVEHLLELSVKWHSSTGVLIAQEEERIYCLMEAALVCGKVVVRWRSELVEAL
jgi:hypothetical protein